MPRDRPSRLPRRLRQSEDVRGNPVGSMARIPCPIRFNPTLVHPSGRQSGLGAPDGKPDGFANPYRHYQALELEANKNFSHNFMLAQITAMRSSSVTTRDCIETTTVSLIPASARYSISPPVCLDCWVTSLPGLPEHDRRAVGNLYGAYVIPSGFVRRFDVGTRLARQCRAFP